MIQNVIGIIREEMNAIGGQELLVPVLQPAGAVASRPGRYEIEELMKLEDRKGSPHVLAMTHEESAHLPHVARDVRSYRDLPLFLYQFQVKERDEPRPRAGVLRTREFVMKDAYSFDRDEAGLDEQYERNRGAYSPDHGALRPRLLRGRIGRRDDGRHGRARVHGAVPGRRERGRRWRTGYAANVEVASADAAAGRDAARARRAARGAQRPA